MYIKLDTRTGELELNLPAGFEEHSAAILSAIMDEFAFEPINQRALAGINAFICNWFKSKGIELPSQAGDNGSKGTEGTGKL